MSVGIVNNPILRYQARAPGLPPDRIQRLSHVVVELVCYRCAGAFAGNPLAPRGLEITYISPDETKTRAGLYEAWEKGWVSFRGSYPDALQLTANPNMPGRFEFDGPDDLVEEALELLDAADGLEQEDESPAPLPPEELPPVPADATRRSRAPVEDELRIKLMPAIGLQAADAGQRSDAPTPADAVDSKVEFHWADGTRTKGTISCRLIPGPELAVTLTAAVPPGTRWQVWLQTPPALPNTDLPQTGWRLPPDICVPVPGSEAALEDLRGQCLVIHLASRDGGGDYRPLLFSPAQVML